MARLDKHSLEPGMLLEHVETGELYRVEDVRRFYFYLELVNEEGDDGPVSEWIFEGLQFFREI